ncbi:MAG: hypothetical protein RMK29_11855 [Myxococcales bacterium]|nr:hypothetical protein [Myxococcota bacterium]MDW8282403.1 hypothetical protein [Myxococcales bacterium]
MSPVPAAVRAPGKALLIGEYAVLDGAPAAVAAVDRYATAMLRPAEPSSPYVRAAIEEARAELRQLGVALPEGVPMVDTSAFLGGGHKLGIGSSAATTVAAVGALFAGAGLDPAMWREAIHRAAAAAHAAAQGERGSGADVLAATMGGIQALHRPAPPVALPVSVRFIATPQSASTATLLRRVREAGALARPALQEMGSAAEEFFGAWAAQDRQGLLRAVERAFEAYLSLERVVGSSLVTPAHAAIHAAARRAGGAAKPSGAGGGDLAVVFLPNADSEEALRVALPPMLSVLPMQVSAEGVHALWRS